MYICFMKPQKLFFENRKKNNPLVKTMNFNKIKVNWLPRCATNTAFCHHKIRMLHTFGSFIITNITPRWEIVRGVYKNIYSGQKYL